MLLALAYRATFGGLSTLIGTPPNAIIFASGQNSIARMAKAGFALNIMAVVILLLAAKWLILPLFLPELDSSTFF